MGDYTADDAASDLEWVERRIGEMVADNWGAESIAKYQACADELRAIVDSVAVRGASCA